MNNCGKKRLRRSSKLAPSRQGGEDDSDLKVHIESHNQTHCHRATVETTKPDKSGWCRSCWHEDACRSRMAGRQEDGPTKSRRAAQWWLDWNGCPVEGETLVLASMGAGKDSKGATRTKVQTEGRVTGTLTLITRLMNNHIKGRRKATSLKEEKVKTKALWQLWKSVSQLGCASQDSDAVAPQGTKEFRWNPMQKVLNAIQRVRFTKSTLRNASIRDKKGSSLGKIQVPPGQQRSPYTIKFEDRSHEETERQERCVQSKAWNPAKYIYKLKANDKTTFFSPTEEWVLPLRQKKSAGRNRVCGGFRG